MSTIKVDNIDSKDSTGNITISRPIVATLTAGSINNLNNLLTPANASVTAAKMATTDTLPAWNGSALTNLPAPADNSVTGAKLNISLLAGDTMYASGTDTLAKLAKGTATQVLTMNTGATAPEWADAGGGAFVLLETSLISSNTSSITLTGMSSTYSSYMLTFSDMIGSANNSEIRLRVGDASAIDAGLGDYSWHSTTKDAKGGSQSSVYGNDGWWALTTASTGKDGTEVSGGIIYFHNSPSVGASRRLMMSGTYVFSDSAGSSSTSATIGHSIIGHYDGGVTVDRVNFEFAGQNVASGRMSLYGIAHA